MADCPTCEYHKQRAQIWRDEVYRLAGHPMPEREQEPVGWIDSKGNMVCTKINESCKPLYTTPQQRTWVGLTKEDKQKLAAEQHSWEDLCSAVEAKLKEKNT